MTNSDFEIWKQRRVLTGQVIQYYYMYDSGPRGMIPCLEEDLQDLNELGNGIFSTQNEFNGPRQQENLVKINNVGTDIDIKSELVLEKILKAPLRPSQLVETKAGYQLCYFIKNATREDFESITEDRLIPYFGGDKNAKDICRVFRVPGFNHWKDVSDPFMVKYISGNIAVYEPRDFIWLFKSSEEEEAKILVKKEFKKTLRSFSGDLYEKINSIDAHLFFERLSGKRCVNGEVYELKKQSNGNWNVWINGKSSSCFVDSQGKIGSLSGGGPSGWQWLDWLGYQGKDIYQIYKMEFPELCLK